MIKIYGIPNIISSSELFKYNNGQGKLRITFEGGLNDPKVARPATYSTDNEFEQIVIESSPLYGKRIFRYGMNGKILNDAELTAASKAVSAGTKPGRPAKAAATASNKSVYEDVKTLGEATEKLLELGYAASELQGPDAVLSVMLANRISFPNLELK